MSILHLSLFERLPEELLLHILKQDLDIKDLKNVRLLGRLWCRIASDNELWINIAKKIGCPLNHQTNVFYDVERHTRALLKKARLFQVFFIEKDYVINWMNENFKDDSEITTKKIKALKSEVETESRWRQISYHIHDNIGCFPWKNYKSSFERSATPNPVIGHLI